MALVSKITGRLSTFPGRLLGSASRKVALLKGLFLGTGRRLTEQGAASAWIFARCYVVRKTLEYLNARSGARRVKCPCCGWEGYDFLPMDGTVFYLPRAYCPHCWCYDRHRVFQLYLERRDPFLLNMKGYLLNYAPERHLHSAIKPNPHIRYIAADLEYAHVTEFRGHGIQSNILQTPLGDNSVEAAVCFHILEHLEDDLAGVREVHRVLKPGGVAYIMVPIDLRLTASVFFGYAHPGFFGHYWSFGPDYPHRLTPFFEWEEVHPEMIMTREEMYRHGVVPQEIIFRCTKRA